MAEYSAGNELVQNPKLAWWTKYTLKKRDRIISKTASKYWQKTHKYGHKIPKTERDTIRTNKENGDTLWWDTIQQEMKNVQPAFELFEEKKDDIRIGYQKIECHMIFDIKLGDNFRRKEQLVGGGHKTVAPDSTT